MKVLLDKTKTYTSTSRLLLMFPNYWPQKTCSNSKILILKKTALQK